MKILFDATELTFYNEKSGHRAGVFFVALNLYRELKKNKDVELVLTCNFKRYCFLKELINTTAEFSGMTLLEEHSVINKFFAKLNYFVRNCPRKIKYGVLSLSRYYENLFYQQNKHNSAQLQDYSIYFSPFTPPSEEILKAKHLKRFLMLHDIIPIIENNGQVPKNPRLWSYRLYNTINKDDFYLTNSECTRNDFLKTYPFLNENQIVTTHLGVDEELFRKNMNGNDNFIKTPYIFSLCTLGKRKNLIFSIRNFFKFIEKYNLKDLKLVLAGGVWKNFEKELQNAIGQFDKSKIEILGYVEDADLPNLYSNAMMFVYPSLYEGFGLPVLEAMKCGCPVITSNTSSLPEVIGDAGIKINPTSDEEMQEALYKIYFDKFYRELCIERGVIRSNNFSWKNCTHKLIQFIKKNCV